jgi:polyisoprenoid-binding protein YceI
MVSIDASAAQVFVYTFKEGLLSLVAHDLKLRFTRFHIDLDLPAGRLEGRFDAASLVTECAMRDGAPAHSVLSAKDRRDIEDNIRKDVLDHRRHPEIRFAATAIQEGPSGYQVSGRLSLQGRERPIAFAVTRRGGTLRAEVRLHQPDYGIKPFSAVFGTLKIKPEITIEVIVPERALLC